MHLIIRPYRLQELLKLVDACQRYSKPNQCRFRDALYNTTEKTISRIRVHVSPCSADTLVRRSKIRNHHLLALTQQHHCQKLPKWVAEHVSGSVAAEFPLNAQTYFCIVTPDPRSVPRFASFRSRSSQFFFTPAHRSAHAHQIFDPLRSSSAPLLFQYVSSSKLKKWTDFTARATMIARY